MSRTRERFFDAEGLGLADLAEYAEAMLEQLRNAPFWLGDIAHYAAQRWPNEWHQAFPAGVSPGQIDRYRGVAALYPREADREIPATWTQYMQVARKPDRIETLRAIVAQGLTSDESRAAQAAARREATDRPRWLLAVDVHYFLHRFWFSGAGVEAATGVAQWVQRTVARLREKGLTDCLCCFDAPTNHRKALTDTWDKKYKDRPPKDPELGQQLRLVRELLDGAGLCCCAVEGYEADDVMASAAAQFPGKTTLLTADKDARQCLGERVNILLDVEWTADESTGDVLPQYKWLSAAQHTEATGIRPDQWAAYQAIMGDATDGIAGAQGIGAKGAADLIREFGSATAAVVAAQSGDERITARRQQALIDFAPRLEVTLQLVTLRRDVTIPTDTRI